MQNVSNELNQQVDESSSDAYISYSKKLNAIRDEHLQPSSKETRFVKLEDREDRSDLTGEDIVRQTKGRRLMQWRGLSILKSPLDYCIYQLMLQEIRPATIIETGTFTGGSALWFADLMKIHDVKTHVYTMDIIDVTCLDPKSRIKSRKDITFIHGQSDGDSYKIAEAFPEDMLKSLPHPWLITEDAHTNIPGVLGYFSKFTQPGDYLVAEDTHPAINKHHSYGSGYEPVGPTKILNPYKEFMKKHGSQYRVDTGYTDMYGYNATFHYNSIVCRV